MPSRRRSRSLSPSPVASPVHSLASPADCGTPGAASAAAAPSPSPMSGVTPLALELLRDAESTSPTPNATSPALECVRVPSQPATIQVCTTRITTRRYTLCTRMCVIKCAECADISSATRPRWNGALLVDELLEEHFDRPASRASQPSRQRAPPH